MSLFAAEPLPDFDKLWNFNKPSETESKFRELLSMAEESKNVDYRLQLLTQIARTQGLQRKFEEAHHTLDDIKKALSQKTSVAEVRYYLERGRVFNSSKKQDLALPLFEKAVDLSIQRKLDNFAVDAAHMMGIAESTSEKKMEWNLKAVQMAEKSKEEKARNWLGSLYNNIGWTFHDMKKFSEALELFKKALTFRQEKGDASAIRVAKWAVARTHRSMGSLDEAIKMQKSLEIEFDALPEKDGYVFEELGELYLAKNQNLDAKKYFAMAFNELVKDEWFKANEAKRLERIRELGGVK